MSDLFCIKPPSGLYKNNFDLTNWLIQPKLDGFRCLFVSDGKTFKAISPNGKPLYNLGHIIKELQSIPGALKYNIDGELKGADWNETSEIVRASVKIKDGSHIKFYCFDIVKSKEYKTKKFTEIYRDRYKTYIKLFENAQNIIPINCDKCIDNDNVWKKAKTFLNQGYEGAVIKDANGLYKCGRSQSIQRLKFTDTLDLKITGFYEGEDGFTGTLGGVICDYNGKSIRIGSGFEKSERQDIWGNQSHFLGRIIEVKYQEKTKAGSLRFPVFVRFRYDK